MITRTPKTADVIEMSKGTDDADAAAPAAAEGVRVQLKMREFVNRVVERSGARKSDAKTVSEAVLAILGEALAKGEDLNLPPLGKVMVKKDTGDERARVLTVKVRQMKAKEA